MSKVSATESERQIFEKEEVRVVTRAPRNTQFDEYSYGRKVSVTTSIHDWYNSSLKPLLSRFDVDVIDGYRTNPHGRTEIKKVTVTQKNNGYFINILSLL